MELYPPHLLSHVSPLVFVQGLGGRITDFPLQTVPQSKSAGESIVRKQLKVDSLDHVTDLVKIWRKFHIDGVLWSSSATKTQLPTHPHRYRFRFIDNDHELPSFKQDDISPMNGEIIPIDWFHKFQSQVPSLFIGFYEIDEDQTKDEALISEMNTLKEQLLVRNVKLLAIVTTSKLIQIEQRVENIRIKTGLNNRNGLLVLAPDFKPKELNIFALEVLQIIKLASSEFYSTIDKKLRKERIKVISQIETDAPGKNAIEVKYCLKVAFINELKGSYDQSSKHYETAYENFIDIFNNGYPLTDPNWSNFRMFLDVIVFHIVRLNFYLEYPNIAYRKFDIHLKSVAYFLNNDEINIESSNFFKWLAFQFKWLAQLSDLAPTSLVPSEYPFKYDVTVSNKLSPLLLPHPGYLYLQVADFYTKSQNAINDEKDPYVLKNGEENNGNELINLLTFAKLAFQKRDNSFIRSIGSINYQIGEEHFQLKDFEKACKFYEQTLDSVKEDDWSYLLSFIHFRLFQCSKELKKVYGSVLNLLELALIPESSIDENILSEVKAQIDQESGFKEFLNENEEILVINATTDSTFDLFEAKALFQNEEISLSNSTNLQLSLSSKLNGILLSTKLDDLLISFNGDSFPSILIKHDASKPSSSSFIRIDDLNYHEDSDSLIANINLTFQPLQEKIIQLELPPTKHIGFNEINSITSILDYESFFKVKLNIPVQTNSFERRHFWQNDEENKKIISTLTPSSINVIPRIPETTVELKNLPKVAIVGETLGIKLDILDTDEELVDLNIDVEYTNDKVSYKWDDVEIGNDTTLQLKSLKKNNHDEHVLYLFIPQNYKTLENKDLGVRLKLSYFINGDHGVPSFKFLDFTLPVIDPFKINMSIQPRLKKSDLESDLSKLIIKESTEENPTPKPTRFWLFRFNTFIDLKADIEVVDETLVVKSENDKIGCFELNYLQKTEIIDNRVVFSHYLDTEILDGHTHRNVQLEILFKFRYKRVGSDVLSTYTNEPWKLALPLLDPRVLLSIKEEPDKEMELMFLLENPTSKVFSFSTTLLDNRHFTVLSGTKQLPNVSVDPLQRQILQFRLKLNTDKSQVWHQLPQLRVYDVNYRVNLPTLVITDSPQTQTHKGDIYVLS